MVWIPPTRFELVSPDPKSCMIDRYTTGVFEYRVLFSRLFIHREKTIIHMHFRTIRIPLVIDDEEFERKYRLP